MKPKYDTATPYIASYLVIRNKGKIAFVLRSNTKWMNGYYGLPSGKVEKGETFTEAAIREAKEETGIEVKAQDLKHLITVHRLGIPDKENLWLDVYFEALKWRGTPFNAEPESHDELAWFTLDDMPENVVPSDRQVLHEIEAGKTYTEWGWDK